MLSGLYGCTVILGFLRPRVEEFRASTLPEAMLALVDLHFEIHTETCFCWFHPNMI